jgi:hypothetical protein
LHARGLALGRCDTLPAGVDHLAHRSVCRDQVVAFRVPTVARRTS